MSVRDRNDPHAVYLGSLAEAVDLLAAVRTVSGVHARILSDGADGWLIEDLGSSNGTRLRDRRLVANQAVPISPGDRVHLGRTASFVFQLDHVAKLTAADTFRGPVRLAVDQHNRASSAEVISGASVQSALAAEGVVAANEPTVALPAASVAPAAQPTLAIPIEAIAPLPARRKSAERHTVAMGGDLPFNASAPAHDGGGDTNVTRNPLGTAGVTLTAPPSPSAFSISLGAADQNDVVVPVSVVSQRHARLYVDGERFLLEDQSSTNGTFFQNRRIQLAEIQLGDVFRLGSHEIRFDEALRAQLLTRRRDTQASGDWRIPLDPGRTFRVGRDASNDIVLAAPMVSSRHAELQVLPSGAGYLVTDLGSTNGTWLNNRDNRILAPTTVSADDVLYFGSYRMPVSRLPALVAERDGVPGDTREAGKRVFVIGRDAGVDVSIDHPQISRRHVEVSLLDDGRFALRDLGSSNGVFVNGERIRARTIVNAQDRISLGSAAVRLDPNTGVVRQEFHGDIMLQAQQVTVDVPDPNSPGGLKRILQDVSFTVYPTEFVGLMGPSGAGKTTLMMALNGYLPPVSGRSLLNGEDLYANYNSFRGRIGYVPQDDIVYPQLTVWESLYYTALLRLPSDTSRQEIHQKVDAILRKLEIEQTRDVPIGDALRKGISGGQRKRVNLAQELITEPSLLFLDEPTSGLASEDTLNVMRLLRSLADDGKTILLTIHQPSLEAYRMMDNVMYLMQGKLVYYGPTWPDSIRFFHPDVEAGPALEKLLADPGNALKPLAHDQREALDAPTRAEREARLAAVVEGRRRAYTQSAVAKEFVSDRAGNQAAALHLDAAAKQRTDRRGLWRQARILVARAARIKIKDRVNTAILLIQAPIIATVLALVFAAPAGEDPYFQSLDRGPAALFLLVAAAVWFGCSNAAREIVGEQAIYIRERMVNLMIPSYVLSKAVVLGIVCAIQCLLLLGIAWLPLGLQGNVFVHYLGLLLASWVGLGMGLTLSSIVRSPEAAVALVPLLLIPQIILGGAIMPVHEMNTPMRALSSAMAARWGYEALLHNEYADDDLGQIQEACGIPTCVWSIGPTGYTYYPGDPTDVAESASTGGVSALAEGMIPVVAPKSRPICQAFCPSVQDGEPISPIDRSFGVGTTDVVRLQAYQDIVVDGGAPAELGVPVPDQRVGLWQALLVLAASVLLLLALVMALLRYRDVEVG